MVWKPIFVGKTNIFVPLNGNEKQELKMGIFVFLYIFLNFIYFFLEIDFKIKNKIF